MSKNARQIWELIAGNIMPPAEFARYMRIDNVSLCAGFTTKVCRTKLKRLGAVASDDLARDQIEQVDRPAYQARHAILVARFRRKNLQLIRQGC